MGVTIHPRVMREHPEVTVADAETAFNEALRSRPRNTEPVQWVGVGTDSAGRLLEFVAVEEQHGNWLVFHAMPATRKVLIEIGLRRR